MILISLLIEWVEQDGNYKGVAITLYSPDEEHNISLIEDKGYHFDNVDIKNGELKPIKAHNTRHKRERKDDHLTNQVKHKVRSKSKNKVKPGYKKKFKQEVERMKRQERKQYSKQRSRQQRKTIKRLGETNVNWLTCINEW